MKIIGICAPAASGKDTVSDYLCDALGFVKIGLADEIKRCAMLWYGFTYEQCFGPSHLRDTAYSPYFPELCLRDVLQKLGTEVGRLIHEATWVDILVRQAELVLARYDPVLGPDGVTIPIGRWRYSQALACHPASADFKPHQGVVVPDVRHLNEIQGLRDRGATIIRLDRPGAGLKGAASQHSSETELLKIPRDAFTYWVDNDGTLTDLFAKIDAIVKTL